MVELCIGKDLHAGQFLDVIRQLIGVQSRFEFVGESYIDSP